MQRRSFFLLTLSISFISLYFCQEKIISNFEDRGNQEINDEIISDLSNDQSNKSNLRNQTKNITMIQYSKLDNFKRAHEKSHSHHHEHNNEQDTSNSTVTGDEASESGDTSSLRRTREKSHSHHEQGFSNFTVSSINNKEEETKQTFEAETNLLKFNKLLINEVEMMPDLNANSKMFETSCFDTCVEKCFNAYKDLLNDIGICSEKACNCSKEDATLKINNLLIEGNKKDNTISNLIFNLLVFISLISLIVSIYILVCIICQKRKDSVYDKYEYMYDSINLDFSREICDENDDKIFDSRIFESNYELMTTEIEDGENGEIYIRNF